MAKSETGMLVLSRKQSEIICIGDNITIEVLRVTPDRVRLGVIAPAHVGVHRKEVYDAIQLERANAAVQE